MFENVRKMLAFLGKERNVRRLGKIASVDLFEKKTHPLHDPSLHNLRLCLGRKEATFVRSKPRICYAQGFLRKGRQSVLLVGVFFSFEKTS